MARFIDLNVFVPDPVRVELDGTVYKLPGDIPAPRFFRLDVLQQRIVEGGDDVEEAIHDLHDELLDLFQVHQPDLTELPLPLRTMLPLVNAYLTGAGDERDDEDDAVPPPARPAGTPKKPSTSPRKASTRKPSSRKASGSPK